MSEVINFKKAQSEKIRKLESILVSKELHIAELMEERSNLIENAWNWEDDFDSAVEFIQDLESIIDRMPEEIKTQYFDNEMLETLKYYKNFETETEKTANQGQSNE